jgi:multiple sugar transport system ATP-binding protein
MASVLLDGVTKVFDEGRGTETAVADANLTVEDGHMVVLVGPSGCGKSTTLRMVAGLESATEGTINIGGQRVNDAPPAERKVAMVFQDYALYPKMSVRANLEYGLKHSTDLSKADRQATVEETATLLGIADLLDHRPTQLSGGQQQRVALGRAIVRQPNVFLMDEPLSNLDARLRARMRTELQRIQSEVGVTTIYVTHDQTEAMTMGDTIAVMNNGEMEQVSSPEYAYNHPANEFVATFLGSPAMNVLDTTLRDTGTATELVYHSTPVARLDSEAELDRAEGASFRLGIRPEHLRIQETVPDAPCFEADISVLEYQGNETYVYLQFEGQELLARTSSNADLSEGGRTTVQVAAEDAYLFDPGSGECLKSRTSELSDN